MLFILMLIILESTITRVTKVVEGKPEVRVIPGGETRITKVIQGGKLPSPLRRDIIAFHSVVPVRK